MDIKILVLGGGCFWCTEAIFRETKGVIDVEAGFSGGFVKNPAYKEVCTGRTGHAEVVKIMYDANIISYEELLIVHFMTHDPTLLVEHGTDKGNQYRSIIFYQKEEERDGAIKVMKNMEEELYLPIVTIVEPFEVFYRAEEKHQNYYNNNKDVFYCQAVIEPKLMKYRALKQDLFF